MSIVRATATRISEIVIPKERISDILFHKGSTLLLDKVTITDGIVSGEFIFSDENCEGHEPAPGMKVVRGVDIVEMAFQLLGVFCSQDEMFFEKTNGKIFAAREITGAVFSGFIKPGEKVVLEMSTEIDVQDLSGIIMVNSGRVVAKVNGKKRCIIASVKIVVFDPRLMSYRAS